ncbi:hypothetical protein [Winogradskyella aquimaris]|uniref:Glycine zipper family protein n=1 Tax=Winogradskyella aquimaris TaxID=864074 RepID=A0ABU5EL75_9FLAO|nr:hypothetical protein [Winogradskyella aquimaris]MDY2586792.1 hypothetical protein [Winogradskyella aquimaris]
MTFIDLTKIGTNNPNPKFKGKLQQLQQLLQELKKHLLPEATIKAINSELSALKIKAPSDPKLYKHVCSTQNRILKYLEKQHKIVPKGYYQQQWLAVGMAAIGIPMGVAFGLALGNLAFLGIGLPIGLAIGMAHGAGMDQKAAKEGQQLQFKSNAL